MEVSLGEKRAAAGRLGALPFMEPRASVGCGGFSLLQRRGETIAQITVGKPGPGHTKKAARAL